jgi:hypothetical protein
MSRGTSRRTINRDPRKLLHVRFVVDGIICAAVIATVATVGAGAVSSHLAPVAASVQTVGTATSPPSSQFRRIPTTPQSPSTGASSTGMNSSVEQELALTIQPGGPLRVTPDRVTVALRQVGDHLVGAFGPIQLVDPRGTLAGWQVLATLSASGRCRVQVIPGHPIAVSGRQEEVTRAKPRVVGEGEPVVLMSADPGGGGTFVVDVSVVVPGRVRLSGSTLSFVITAH